MNTILADCRDGLSRNRSVARHRNSILGRSIIAGLMLTALAPAQTATGFVKVGSNRWQPHYAVAARVPDTYNKSKQVIWVVLSEAPVPRASVLSTSYMASIRTAWTTNMIQLKFTEFGVDGVLHREEVGTNVYSSLPKDSCPYQITNGRISGKIEARGANEKPPYEISATYSAVLDTRKNEPPTAAEISAAQKHPAAAAYFEYDNAWRSGDKIAIQRVVRPEYRPYIERNLLAYQADHASNIKADRVTEEFGWAFVQLSGVKGGKAVRGEAILRLEDGKWRVQGIGWDAPY